MVTFPDIAAVEIEIGGKKRSFDIDDPKLPAWVDDKAFSSGGYPYEKKLDKDEYAETLERLQIELVKAQYWLQATGKRYLLVGERLEDDGPVRLRGLFSANRIGAALGTPLQADLLSRNFAELGAALTH